MKTHESNRTRHGRSLTVCAVAVLTLSFVLPLPHQVLAFDLDLQLVGSYDTSGFAIRVAVSGNYVYIADADAGLQVIDVSNSANPRRVGGCDTSGTSYGVAISGNFAYVADGASGLLVIDISNPANPQRVGRYDTGYAINVAVSGNYAYLIDSLADLLVIDISDPPNPQPVSRYDAAGAQGVAVSGDYAYLTVWPRRDGTNYVGGGLHVIDVSNPTHLQRIGYVSGESAGDVAILGSYAYIAANLDGLVIIDVSNPTNPRIVGSHPSGDLTHGVAICGNYAYVTIQHSGLHVMDISDPARARRVAGYDTIGTPFGVAISNNCVYVVDGTEGLLAIAANPANPQRVGGYNTTGYATDIVVSDDYAYVADGEQGFQIINISDPVNPHRVGGLSGYAVGIAVSDNHCYVLDYYTGLHVIRVANPANPQSVGAYPTIGYPQGVAVVGDFAYLLEVRWHCESDGEFGEQFCYVVDSLLHVIDISHPQNLRRISSYRTSDNAQDVAICGNYAYVADGHAGLQVIDISDPRNPRRVAGYDTAGYAFDVAISGNHAYVIDDVIPYTSPQLGGFLEIIDISNPLYPQPVGRYRSSAALSVAVCDKYAYLTDSRSSLQVIDIGNPASPTRVGGNSSFRTASAVTVGNGKVFLAAAWEGLSILHTYQPIRFEQIAQRRNGGKRLRIAGPPGVPGRVQRSSDLRAWADWLPVNFSESPIEISDSDAASASKRFYRLAVP